MSICVTARIEVISGSRLDWRVGLIDTGLNTMTGGRLRRLKSLVGNETCMATYGDGLSDVDLAALLAFHKEHGKLATVTAVRPPARFGGLRLANDAVAEFTEKPQAEGGWINGGFFVFEPACIRLPGRRRDDSRTRTVGAART